VADETPTPHDLVQQTQEEQRQLVLARADLAELEVVGIAGGGLVTVIMRGDGEVTGVAFDPAVFDEDDARSLGDLTLAALRHAADTIRSVTREQSGQLGPA
jgi:nucleoid-associated protein EbfC